MAARPPSGAGSAKAKPSTSLTKLTKLADKGSKKLQKRDKDVAEKPEKKRSKSASTDSGKGEKKQKSKDRPATSSEKTSNKRAKAGDALDAPQKQRRRNADSLELPDIRPRKNWKVMDDAMRGRCLSMVDQALLCAMIAHRAPIASSDPRSHRLARNSESGNAEHKARVDKNLAMLRERIEALFSDIKVPNRTAGAIAQKKQVRLLRCTRMRTHCCRSAPDRGEHRRDARAARPRAARLALRDTVRSRMILRPHPLTWRLRALAAEKEREQALVAEVASLQKRVHDLTTQKVQTRQSL